MAANPIHGVIIKPLSGYTEHLIELSEDRIINKINEEFKAFASSRKKLRNFETVYDELPKLDERYPLPVFTNMILRGLDTAPSKDITDAMVLTFAYPETSGIKHDKEKPRLDLLPYDALLRIGDVLTYGAAKYAPRNWESGMDWGRLSAAAQRHIASWQCGQDDDEESGLPHLAHAVCCLLFLLAYSIRRIGKDDRGSYSHVNTVQEKEVKNETEKCPACWAVYKSEEQHPCGNPYGCDYCRRMGVPHCNCPEPNFYKKRSPFSSPSFY